MTGRQTRLALAAAVLAAAAGCFYSPSFEPGQFTCRQDVCPGGFVCSGPPAFLCVENLGQVPDGGDLPVDVPGDATPDAPPDGAPCTPDPLEPNDDQVNARAIGPGTNLVLGIPAGQATLCPEDEDWYRIDLDRRGLLVRLTADDANGLTMELLDVAGRSLDTASPDGTTALVLASPDLAPNTYFVRVAGVASSSAGTRYGLMLESPPNDQCFGAVVLEPAAGSVGGIEAVFDDAEHHYDPGAGAAQCTGASETGLDLTYELTLSAASRVIIFSDANGPPDSDLRTGVQSDFSLMLVRGDEGPGACDDLAATCIGGSSTRSVKNPLPRGEDPFIDRMLGPGRYFVIASNRTPAQDRPSLLVAFNLAAACNSRQECDVTSPSFCIFDYSCIAVEGGFTEVQPPGTKFAATDIPDGQPSGTPGMLLTPIVVGGFDAADVVDQIAVGVDLRHTWRGDLDITLISPPDPTQGGQPRRVRLLAANPNDTGNGVREVFPLTAVPAESLDAMRGAPVNGQWQLEILDNANLDLGRLQDVRLFIRAQ